jgi:hypothetical protein
MKYRSLFIFAFFFSACHHNAEQPKQQTVPALSPPSAHRILATTGSLPLHLSKINFSKSQQFEVPANVDAKIDEELYSDHVAMYPAEGRDTYFNTVQLNDGEFSYYLIIIKQATGMVNSILLKADNKSQVFYPGDIEFKLHAMYDISDSSLKPSNLMDLFKITSAEIDTLTLNGSKCLKLTRLYHNGTENKLETTIVKWTSDKIDTLDTKSKWLNR